MVAEKVAESATTPALSKLLAMSAPGKSRRGGGVLSVNAAATRRPVAAQGQAKSAQRAPVQRLRLILRRLPPGLTEAEFWNALGLEWRSGEGKTDWAAYKDGKVSKECVNRFSFESPRN